MKRTAASSNKRGTVFGTGVRRGLIVVILTVLLSTSALASCALPGGSAAAQATDGAAVTLSAKIAAPTPKPEKKSEKKPDGSRVETTYSTDGTVKLRESFDSDGNKTERRQYSADGVLSSWTEYDSKGRALLCKEYSADGILAFWDEFEYNSNGEQVKMLSNAYNDDGTLNCSQEYEYDSKAKTTRARVYDENADFHGWAEFEYASDGLMPLCRSYNDDGTIKYDYD